MSHPGPDPNSLSTRFRNISLDSVNGTQNKPDFRELDLGSPVSPLQARVRPAPSGLSSSSNSSGSVSGPTKRPESGTNSHSGELSGSVESSPTRFKSGQTRSDPVTSPAANVLPPVGNICPSGRILKTGMASPSLKKPGILGSGARNYGHGSIMRGGGSAPREAVAADPEELKRMGNDRYKKGEFFEAIELYDRAIAISPKNATYRFNKAVALSGVKRFLEAVKECEEAIKLDSGYVKAHHRLGLLLIRLGQVENARRHLCFPGYQPDPNELIKLKSIETYLNKCTDARKNGNWKSVLREADAAIAAGADSSPQMYACKAEAFLKLHQLEEANASLSNVPKSEMSDSSISQPKFFGMISLAYLFFVRAQVEMAFGRFESAVSLAEKAGTIEPRNNEVLVLLNNVRLVSRARTRGNDLYKAERFTEACSAYGEGLRIDPSNSVLYCNRAACWYKLGKWEHSVDDSNKALSIQPNYTKALLRRAASNNKLERWAEAVRDYEALRKELTDDNEVAENLFHAQVALKKSRGEDVYNMKFGGEVELITGLEQFRAAISSPSASVVLFKDRSNLQCKQISPFLDTLCRRYPSINFLKVDMEQSHTIVTAESVRIVPTFKIYKNGERVKEMICPSPEVLESSVRHYSF